MSDLLSTLGKKDSTQKKEETTSGQTNEQKHDSLGIDDDVTSRGKNLLTQNQEAATQKTETKESGSETGKVETKDQSTVDEFDKSTWTPESMFKEIKKLREENKQTRLKYAERATQVEKEAADRLAAKEVKFEEVQKAADELASLKSKEEDKKRSLEEKVAHRESRISELEALREASVTDSETKLVAMEAKLRDFEADREAQQEVYKIKLQEELASVPEKYRTFADQMVKNVSDSREALLVLSEARMSGMFDEKSVHVNHSVPGANDGARSSQDKLDAAAKEERGKMSSSDLIKEGLKRVRSGEPNSVFRTG